MIRPQMAVNGRILDMLRNGTLTSVCALLLWIGGCPKRQDPKSIVVYVPAQAPAAAPPATKSAVMVIEEPAPPPEPEEIPPPQTPEPTAHRRPRRPALPETPTEPNETQEIPETPPAEVPALEPRQTSAQETELRRQFQNLDHDIRQRLARLNGAQLSANDRKTLEDARTFFAQATHARASGDLPRALNLAHKAALLLAALE
jgi:outer membrane biosynthesis protein TonB